MRNLQISFEMLPEAISIVLSELDQIKKILNPKIQNEPPPQKKLSASDLIIFLREYGLIISKSKLYKLTSANEIPHSKFNNRLVFNKIEIQKWAEDKLSMNKDNTDNSRFCVIKSAKLKSTKK